MEDEYKVVYALYRIVPLSITLSDPVSRSQYSLKANISQTVHPIHSMLWFSGSADRMALGYFAVR